MSTSNVVLKKRESWRIQTATDLFQGTGLTMPPEHHTLKRYVDRSYSGYQVYIAYEAGCCGYSAHRAFESYGWKSIVFNPADLSRTGKMMYQKTDGLDAKLICRELKDDRLRASPFNNL